VSESEATSCHAYFELQHLRHGADCAENLRRELPPIPLVGRVILRSEATKNLGSAGTANPEMLRFAQHDGERAQGHRHIFWAFSKAGKELARLHIDYEKLEPYPLRFIETCSGVLGAEGVRSDVGPSGARPRGKHGSGQVESHSPGAERRSALPTPFSYRVEDKMRLSKDRRSLKVNDSLTLAGIPPEAFEYRLGNRSALEWVIDQYQVTEDKHTGIRSDPNRADDPEYIVRLVGQVIYVSLETVRTVKSLPDL